MFTLNGPILFVNHLFHYEVWLINLDDNMMMLGFRVIFYNMSKCIVL
jgi:hypothetical protein